MYSGKPIPRVKYRDFEIETWYVTSVYSHSGFYQGIIQGKQSSNCTLVHLLFPEDYWTVMSCYYQVLVEVPRPTAARGIRLGLRG